MALTPEQKALARHRFERAETTLNEAKDELSRNNYRFDLLGILPVLMMLMCAS